MNRPQTIGDTLQDMVEIINHVHESLVNENILRYLILRMHIKLADTDSDYKADCAANDPMANTYTTDNDDDNDTTDDLLDTKITVYQAQCILRCFEKRNEKESFIREVVGEIPQIRDIVQHIYFSHLREYGCVAAILGTLNYNPDLPKDYYMYSLLLDDLIDYNAEHITTID